jgi:hypothetical protein
VQTQWSRIQKRLNAFGNAEERLVLLERVEMLVTQLFLWFGSYLFSTEIDENDADDKEFVCAYPPTHKLGLSECGIRFYLSIFFVLFRLLYIERHAIRIPSKEDNCYPFEVESFHVEAGVDDFHSICMYTILAPGNFISYKVSFAGYYNNISQVVYKEFASYKRRFPISIADVQRKDCSEHEAIVSALVQIHPEIAFAYEDHHFEKEVGSVKVPVLVSPPKKVVPRGSGKNKTDTTLSAGRGAKGPSDEILLRIAACKSNTEKTKAENVVEGGQSREEVDFYWFVIGSEILLVSIDRGEIFRGNSKDLLEHYLSMRKAAICP